MACGQIYILLFAGCLVASLLVPANLPLVALALTSANSVMFNFQEMVRYLVDMSGSLSSAERMQEYSRLPQ